MPRGLPKALTCSIHSSGPEWLVLAQAPAPAVARPPRQPTSFAPGPLLGFPPPYLQTPPRCGLSRDFLQATPAPASAPGPGAACSRDALRLESCSGYNSKRPAPVVLAQLAPRAALGPRPFQLQAPARRAPGTICIPHTPAPAGLPKTPSTQSTKGSRHKVTPPRPDRWLFRLMHRNKHRERDSQQEETEKHGPNERPGQNPRKRTK